MSRSKFVSRHRPTHSSQSRGSMGRGVQYVHCVMHKCIMVKLGRNKKHIKYVKNVNFLRNQRGNLQRLGVIKISPKLGGNILKHRKFGRMKIEKCFLENVNLGKFSTEADKFFGISGGNLKQGGNASMPQGDGRLPGLYPSYK